MMDYREKPKSSKNKSKQRGIIDSITVSSGLITIFGFLTGFQSINYFSGNSPNNLLPTGISFSILFLLTLIIFAIFFVVQMRVANYLYKKHILTIDDLFHKPADHFFVIFFGFLGVGFIAILIDANWGFDITAWSANDAILIAIYCIITVPISFYMAKTTKCSCDKSWID